MTEEHDFSDQVIQHGGWFAAACVGIWGWILKFALAEHLRGLDKINRKVDDISDRLAHIEGHLGIGDVLNHARD